MRIGVDDVQFSPPFDRDLERSVMSQALRIVARRLEGTAHGRESRDMGAVVVTMPLSLQRVVDGYCTEAAAARVLASRILRAIDPMLGDAFSVGPAPSRSGNEAETIRCARNEGQPLVVRASKAKGGFFDWLFGRSPGKEKPKTYPHKGIAAGAPAQLNVPEGFESMPAKSLAGLKGSGKKLGEGFFGEVYKISDKEVLKVFKGNAGHTEAKNEFRKLQQWHERGLSQKPLKLFWIPDAAPNPAAAMTSEFVDGITLDNLLERPDVDYLGITNYEGHDVRLRDLLEDVLVKIAKAKCKMEDDWKAENFILRNGTGGKPQLVVIDVGQIKPRLDEVNKLVSEAQQLARDYVSPANADKRRRSKLKPM